MADRACGDADAGRTTIWMGKRGYRVAVDTLPTGAGPRIEALRLLEQREAEDKAVPPRQAESLRLVLVSDPFVSACFVAAG